MVRTFRIADLPSWDDDYWLESGDGPWRRQLRYQQGWWRETHLGLPPGPLDVRSPENWPIVDCAGTYLVAQRLAVSMLPLGVGHSPNLMTNEAITAAERALDRLATKGANGKRPPGIIKPDRLKRNLLSSQPLCFNLFGYLQADPNALIGWVRTFSPSASTVTAIELEWAPTAGTIGGSAFDAFVMYEREDGVTGFIGIECKYAEDLKESLRDPADQKWVAATQSPQWQLTAADELNQTGLRQFWFNQLLAQIVARDGWSDPVSDERVDFAEGFCAVVACEDDVEAARAVTSVRDQLTEEYQQTLRFAPLEAVVTAVAGHDEWKSRLGKRYFDFTAVPSRHRHADGTP